MEINKKLLSLTLAFMLVFVLSGFVSGLETENVTVSIPGVSGTLSGTAIFNCTIVAGYEDENWTRIRTYFQSSSLTANTTETSASAWVTNDTDDLNLNGTIDTTIVEDGNDYIFKCQVWNGTDYVNKSRTGITIDNTIPQSATSLTPTSDDDGSFTFSGAVVGVNTTSCTLYFDGINPGSSSYAMTHTGDTCTYAITSIPEQTYKWYIRASDETNTTDSSTQTTNVNIDTPSNYLFQGQKDIQVDGDTLSIASGFSNIPIAVWIVVILVVIVVIFNIQKR